MTVRGVHVRVGRTIPVRQRDRAALQRFEGVVLRGIIVGNVGFLLGILNAGNGKYAPGQDWVVTSR